MLEAILRNVATSDLINCRQVNRKWNEISSHIMRQRADFQIVFSLELMHDKSMQRLSDLIDCLERSKHFPFSSFRFKNLGTNERERDYLERFWTFWGDKIYALDVKIDETNDAELLRVLILEKVPNLKKLGIDFTMDLFDKSPIHLNVGLKKLKLPKLNALRAFCVFERFSGIVEDILEAAPNLKFFEKRSLDFVRLSEQVTAKELTILHALDKLHCLENVSLMFKEEMITCLEKSPQIMDLQFKSIELPIDWLDQADLQLCTRTTELINKIFDSSRNSLQTLKIPPLGWLPGLIIPKFENLQKLEMSHDEELNTDDEIYCMFPPQFDMTVNFPNLRQLSKIISNSIEY